MFVSVWQVTVFTPLDFGPIRSRCGRDLARVTEAVNEASVIYHQCVCVIE